MATAAATTVAERAPALGWALGLRMAWEGAVPSGDGDGTRVGCATAGAVTWALTGAGVGTHASTHARTRTPHTQLLLLAPPVQLAA
eukprot:COSAG01_NODE_4263_length_5198_cov_77.376937_4_plen_86_part_00